MASYDFSSDKDQIIFFKPSRALEAADIITSFLAKVSGAKKASSGFIGLRLNAKYDQKTVISDIYPDSWSKTINKFQARAKDKGISKVHIEMITDVLDDNAGKLIKQISHEREYGVQHELSRKDIPVI